MPDDDKWLDKAQAYRQRTGEDMRDVYLALLALIGTHHPRVMAETVRRLESLYPSGPSAGPASAHQPPENADA